MAKKEYDTFVDDPKTLLKEEGVVIAIRDLTPGPRKYDSRYVKAKVADSPDKLPDSDILWIRYQRGEKLPTPWAIKIMEELGEFIELKTEVRT